MNTSVRHAFAVVAVTVIAALAGCQTTPDTEAKKDTLNDNSQAVLTKFRNIDPSLARVLDHSVGYAVFPNAGKGGLIIGGAYGRGTVYEGGKMIGYADITQATIGAQIGGQSFSELVVFQTGDAMNRFKSNQLSFTADVSAVAIDSGVGDAAKFEHGVAVFIQPEKGLMAGAVVGGQKFTYESTADAAKINNTESHSVETKTTDSDGTHVHTETETVK